MHSVQIHGVEEIHSVSTETIVNHSDSADDLDPLSVRRLAETYNTTTASTYAHADNGSMACTVNDEKLLFAYRPLNNSSVRLFDAGNHVHRPFGVSCLCVPTENCGIGGLIIRLCANLSHPHHSRRHHFVFRDFSAAQHLELSHIESFGRSWLHPLTSSPPLQPRCIRFNSANLQAWWSYLY